MKSTSLMLILIAGSLAAVAGCSAEPTTAATQPDTAMATNDTSADAPSAAEETFTGRVAETMDAGTYTYVRVENDEGMIWAASGRFQIAVGDRVVVPLTMPMENFHSDSLDRDFPVIYFAQAIPREGDATAPAMPAGHPPVTGAAAAHGSVAVPPIEPVAGGVTVSQIWSSRESLAGSTVVVRGQVVKFNGGIMGTNWIHLQDGSGSSSTGTHDITVTSPASVSVGDIVTATGTVAVDRDFGAGYSYPVLIENAAVVPE